MPVLHAVLPDCNAFHKCANPSVDPLVLRRYIAVLTLELDREVIQGDGVGEF